MTMSKTQTGKQMHPPFGLARICAMPSAHREFLASIAKFKSSDGNLSIKVNYPLSVSVEVRDVTTYKKCNGFQTAGSEKPRLADVHGSATLMKAIEPILGHSCALDKQLTPLLL